MGSDRSDSHSSTDLMSKVIVSLTCESEPTSDPTSLSSIFNVTTDFDKNETGKYICKGRGVEVCL